MRIDEAIQQAIQQLEEAIVPEPNWNQDDIEDRLLTAIGMLALILGQIRNEDALLILARAMGLVDDVMIESIREIASNN